LNNLAAASPWIRRSWSPNYSVLVWQSALSIPLFFPLCDIYDRLFAQSARERERALERKSVAGGSKNKINLFF
jgi:hypothetical protein